MDIKYRILSMKTVIEEAISFYKNFHSRLQIHHIPLIKKLSIHPNYIWQSKASSKKELVSCYRKRKKIENG